MKNLIIDCFAGGGGASTGIEMALGRQVDIAINHDPDAILMHKTNHPNTVHLTEDIFKVNLQTYVKGQHVALMWASPDCTSHSKAKGDKPRESGLRMLPWAVYKHAKNLLPDVIIIENVEEIQLWGPLDENGHPIKEQEGQDYKKFITAMLSLGYRWNFRKLVAADYGAPTTRKRWYAIFRRDGKDIVWPEQTHNKTGSNGLKKWNPIWKYLRLDDIGKSIFDRKKPLAEKTLNRIRRGIEKFVINDPEPFIVQVDRAGRVSMKQGTTDPVPAITAGSESDTATSKMEKLADKYRYAAFLTKFYKSGTGQSMCEPIHTITTSPGHFGQVSVAMIGYEQFKCFLESKDMGEEKKEALLKKCTWISQFIMEYYGNGTGQSLMAPLHTIVAKDRFALITLFGEENVILDICLRMLSPEELKLGQGFPADYIIDRDYDGNKYPIAKQVARIGNSVVPTMAQKLVEANCGYLKVGERIPKTFSAGNKDAYKSA